MKQVTGNNGPANNRELSIQITLNGFSFAISGGGQVLYSDRYYGYDFPALLSEQPPFDTVNIGWSTDMVQLIPASLFDPAYCAEYLRCTNMMPPQSVVLYDFTEDNQIVAVWSVSSAIFDAVSSLYPESDHYHNLLIDLSMASAESVRVSVIAGMANIVVSSTQGLWVAESVAEIVPADLLYITSKLSAVDSFARYSLHFTADDTTPYTDIFSQHFQTTQFIDNHNIYHNIITGCE